MTTTVSLAGNVGAKDVYADNTFYAAPTSAVTINAPAEHLASFLAAGYTFNGESGNAATATALQTARTIDGRSFDGTANITVVGPATHAATSKATPVDADELPISDSAATFVLKRLTWANLKATAKAYFDTLYQTILTLPLSIANGGTGAATQQSALDALAGAVTANRVLRGDGTHVSLAALVAADVPGVTTSAGAGDSGKVPKLNASGLVDSTMLPGTATQGLVYAGYLGADGSTGNSLPAGWTAASGSTGVYTITHGLALSGSQRLALTAEAIDSAALTDVPIILVTAETANTTTIKIVSAVAVPALFAAAFYFHAKVIP